VKLLAFLLPVLLAACASAPKQSSIPDQAAEHAAKMVGKPYR